MANEFKVKNGIKFPDNTVQTTAAVGGTYSAGSGLTLTGTTFSHTDTSSQASVNNSNGSVIQDITLDTFGHITAITSTDLDSRYYTETESDSRFVNVSGDTMTGTLNVPEVVLTTSQDSITSDSSIASWIYEKVLTVSGQESEPRDLAFSSDGVYLYVLGNSGNDINQYTLSTPWDISTAVYTRVFSVNTQETTPYGLFFKPDGSAFYVIGSTSPDNVYQYSLTTAWDISTASYVQAFSVTAKESDPQAVAFSPDGANMYVTGTISDSVHQYTLSTPWNISTATFLRTFSVASFSAAPQGLDFNTAGTKMYVVGSTYNRITEFVLSTAWNISTATASGSVNASLLGSAVTVGLSGVHYEESQNKLYVTDYNSDAVYQLDTATPATKLTGSRFIFDSDVHLQSDLLVYNNIHSNNNIIATTSIASYGSGYIAGTLDVRGAVDLADSDILRFGSSDDWEMYHNGTANFIDLTNGNLIFRDDGTTGDPTILTLERTSGNLTALGTVSGSTLTSTVAQGTAPLSVTSTTLVTNLNADLLDGQHGSYYAPLNSPNLTGTPVAPTASAGTNTTQIATTAFVQTAVANLVDASPTTLDTLNELAAALGDDPNFATTVSNSIGLKLDSSAYTASDVLTKIKTVDGAGSDLDADLLDGNHASAFALATHVHDYLSSSTTSTQNGYFGNIYLYDDSTPSHYLAVTNSANLTADRTLSVNVNDADRTISLSGNLTVSSAATVSGTNTGDQTNIAGNAATATALQTARTIGGVSFDGTANINLPGVNTAGNQNTTGNAANVTGTVAIANGGTGSTTKTDAFDALSPATTKGDLIVDNGTNNIRLPVGSDGDVLTADSTVAAGVKWAAAAGGSTALTISNKTAAYTVVAGDLGTIINCTSGTFTVSLTAAATLGSGFNCWVWNTSTTSTHVITIDPNASETIDGASTLVLRRGEGCQIVCDGTNWQTGDKKTMRAYAENLSVSFSRPVASGDSAIAIGAGSSASAAYSAAIGIFTVASGSGSIAIGSGANASPTASATEATALGPRTTASSNYSTAIGINSGTGGSVATSSSGAMALGGSYASGTDSFAASIANNTSTYGATSNNTIAIGYLSRATAGYSAAVGSSARASGSFSYAYGYSAQAWGAFSYAIGHSTTATGSGAMVFGYESEAGGSYTLALGYRSYAPTVGKMVYASGQFSARGDAQNGNFVLRSDTTDATSEKLTTDNSTAGFDDQIILPNNSAYAFTGIAVARQSAAQGTASAAWKIEGLIRREGSAGTTVLVNSALTVLSNVPGWGLALSADTTNGGLAVTVTGAASTNIRWVATVQTSEVTYA